MHRSYERRPPPTPSESKALTLIDRNSKIEVRLPRPIANRVF